MNFRETQEFKELYESLLAFEKEKKASSYYKKSSAKTLIKAIIQRWLDENNIDANIRLERTIYRRKSESYWDAHPVCIDCDYIQLYNGKEAIDKKSRWLNKITIRPSWYKNVLTTTLVNSVARTDKDYLEPSPSNFRDFIHALFQALAITK